MNGDPNTSMGVVRRLNNHERHANPNLSNENVVSAAYELLFEPAAGPGYVLVMTTHIIHGVDDDGADL